MPKDAKKHERPLRGGQGGSVLKLTHYVFYGCLATALIAGCQQRMADQPSYRPFEPSSFFADGLSARQPVPGTVARGVLLGPELRLTGKDGDRDAEHFPFPITRRVLERGR